MRFTRLHLAHPQWSARSKTMFTSCSSAWRSCRCDVSRTELEHGPYLSGALMIVRCMQMVRSVSACERDARTASCMTSRSCNSHQASEDGRHQIGDGAGSVPTRELTGRIQQAEQLLLVCLENIVASVVACEPERLHSGRRKDAGLKNGIGELLAAFEHLRSEAEVRSDANRAATADTAQRLCAT